MRWTVTYSPSAEDELVEIWLNAADQPAVASAADQIDELLAIDPTTAGESRTAHSRIVVEHPLAVEYVVREMDLVVVVKAVRRLKPR